MNKRYAFTAAAVCGIILAALTAYGLPKFEGLRGTGVIFRVTHHAPRNRKEKRGRKYTHTHKPASLNV